MAKPKGKVKIVWTPAFAYAIGLLTSDGNLSPNGRHIHFTSKDQELAEHFINALDIGGQHIGRKASGSQEEKKYYVVQFSDVLFYRFLMSIGLMPNKSRLLTKIDVPSELFPHFLRGLFDGDGTFFSYWDPRWKSSFMYYSAFASASPPFLGWLQLVLKEKYDINGKIGLSSNATQQLRFAKKATVRLCEMMYRGAGQLYLQRKYLKISAALSIVAPPINNAQVEKR